MATVPTKAELWAKVLQDHEQMSDMHERCLVIINQNTEALQQSAAALNRTTEATEALSKKFDVNTQAQTKLIGEMSKSIVDQHGGVPTKTFAIVVLALVAIMLALAGLDYLSIIPGF